MTDTTTTLDALTMTDNRAVIAAADHLHDLLTRGGSGHLFISETPYGLWYSDSVFAKPADEPLRLLLASRQLELTPAAYTIDMPDDGDEFAPDEETWDLVGSVDVGKVLPDPAAPSVSIEPVRLVGRPVLVSHPSPRLAYVFRRPDDQLVLLNPEYVHLLAGPDDAAWRFRQSEADANHPVSFEDASGRLAGILMPVRHPRTRR